MKGLELFIVVGYAALMIIIGLYYRKKAAKSSSSFWSAEASVPIVVNAFCLFATVMSGGGMMGNIGLAAATGIVFILSANLGSGCGLGMGAMLVARPLRKSGAKTVSEFIQMRYESNVIGIAVPVVIMITYTIYLVAQMKAAGTVGEYLLGVPYTYALIATWTVFTIYVMTGGMFAVTWTDFFQGCLMFLVTIVAAVATLTAVGGWSELIGSATEIMPTFGTLYMPLSAYAGFFFLWVFVGLCSPHILMRVGTTKSPFAATISLHGGMIIITLFSILSSMVLGAGARVFMGVEQITNNDAAFLFLIDNIFGPIWRGLTGAAIYAAVMSTAAGLLLAAAAALSNDIISKRKPNWTDRQHSKFGGVACLIISFIVLLLSFNPPEFLTLLYSQAMAFMVSALMVPMMAGLWWKRATSLGAILALLSGAISYAILFFGMDLPSFSEIFFSLPISIIFMIIGSYASIQPTDEVIARVAGWHEE